MKLGNHKEIADLKDIETYGYDEGKEGKSSFKF